MHSSDNRRSSSYTIIFVDDCVTFATSANCRSTVAIVTGIHRMSSALLYYRFLLSAFDSADATFVPGTILLDYRTARSIPAFVLVLDGYGLLRTAIITGLDCFIYYHVFPVGTIQFFQWDCLEEIACSR